MEENIDPQCWRFCRLPIFSELFVSFSLFVYDLFDLAPNYNASYHGLYFINDKVIDNNWRFEFEYFSKRPYFIERQGEEIHNENYCTDIFTYDGKNTLQ